MSHYRGQPNGRNSSVFLCRLTRASFEQSPYQHAFKFKCFYTFHNSGNEFHAAIKSFSVYLISVYYVYLFSCPSPFLDSLHM